MWTEFICPMTGPLESAYEYENEISGLKKYGEILDYYLFKKDSAPWSSLVGQLLVAMKS
jgi:hypothetical protein